MRPISILGSGIISGVGFGAAESCAAIRAGVNGFVDTQFAYDGDWLVGCPVPLDDGSAGRERFLRMASLAVEEVMQYKPSNVLASDVPLILCLAENDRPGRLSALDATFFKDLCRALGINFSRESRIISQGRCGGIHALHEASGLLAAGHSYCIIAGVDSLLLGRTLAEYHARRRLLTTANSDGFIPGEAAAAVLVGPPSVQSGRLHIVGLGFGKEQPQGYGGRSLARGLTDSIRAAMSDSGLDWDQIQYRLTDISGEQCAFKETAVASTRLVRPVKPEFELWHPADCVGETGAAIAPIMLAVAQFAARKGYARGPGVLVHCSNDDGLRASAVAVASGVEVL